MITEVVRSCNTQVAAKVKVRIQTALGDQLKAASDFGVPFRQVMTHTGRLAGDPQGCLYRVSVPASRPSSDYTVQAVPCREGVSVPLETSWIVWQK